MPSLHIPPGSSYSYGMHWALLILLALLWGPSFLVIKIGLEGIPPLTLATGRVAIAAVMLYIMLKATGGNLPRTRDFWTKFTIMGLLSNAIPFALLFVGETLASSALAAILVGTTPIGAALMAHVLIPEEPLRPMTVVGILGGFAGILLLFVPALKPGLSGNQLLLGMLAFLGCAVGYSSGMVYSRKALRGYPKLVAPTAQMLTATILLAPAALAIEWNQIALPGIVPVGAMLWLGVIATAIAGVVYYRLLEIAGATFLSLVTFLLPPIGVVLGIVFLDETVDWNGWVGCGLILIGVGFVRNQP